MIPLQPRAPRTQSKGSLLKNASALQAATPFGTAPDPLMASLVTKLNELTNHIQSLHSEIAGINGYVQSMNERLDNLTKKVDILSKSQAMQNSVNPSNGMHITNRRIW